jgi:hypothetical protein
MFGSGTKAASKELEPKSSPVARTVERFLADALQHADPRPRGGAEFRNPKSEIFGSDVAKFRIQNS